MSNVIQVDPVISLYWLLPAFLIVGLFFTWRESRLAYRFRRLRVFAQLVALISLLGVLLRPTVAATEVKPGILLLTPNYSARVADSLLMKDKDMLPMVAPDANAFRDAVRINSFHEVPAKGNLKYVLGDGIPTAEREIFGDDAYEFLANTALSGIVRLATETYPSNRKNWVRGMVSNLGGTVLRLIGPGGREDSVQISGQGQQTFALSFFSKRAGLFTYTLSRSDPQGKSSSESIPIEVVAPRLLRILILQRYPIADIKFLKNYLAEKGHSVTVRYQLSKRNVRYEFANNSIPKFDVLNRQVLKSVDLVITDDDTYGNLVGEELSVLEKGVREGLGLLVMFQHDVVPKGFVGRTLNFEKDMEAFDTIRYTVPGFGLFTGPVSTIRSMNSSINQVTSAGPRTLSGYRLLGDGKLGFQLLRETYSLSLGGETDAYAALWTPLLEQLARRQEMTCVARVVTPFPIYPDEPVTVEVISSGKVPRITADGARLPLLEDVRADDVWFGKTWAGEPGWHSVLEGDSVVLNYWVSPTGAWSSWRQASQQRSNHLAVGAPGMSEPVTTRTLQKPVSPWIFLFLFVVSSGFLWLAPKL